VFRVTALLTGAAAFAAAHAVEVAGWHGVFAPGSANAAWFLNSGRAVAFTAACLFFASFTCSLLTRSARLSKSARTTHVVLASNLACGAIAAMTAVLAAIGPGSIFPLALVIGALIAAAACGAGVATATKM
jgi:hypothetical protein